MPIEPDRIVDSFLRRGNELYQEGLYDNAIKAYTAALDAAQTNRLGYPMDVLAQLHYRRGLAYQHDGHYEEAIADYDKTLSMLRDYGDAYYNRALCYREQGRDGEAISDFTRAVLLNPEDPMAYNERGITLAEMGELHLAIADFAKAIEIDPGYAPARANLRKASSMRNG